jgi:hypothetical protein
MSSSIETSDFENITSVGIEDLIDGEFIIYHNPTNGLFTISIPDSHE